MVSVLCFLKLMKNRIFIKMVPLFSFLIDAYWRVSFLYRSDIDCCFFDDIAYIIFILLSHCELLYVTALILMASPKPSSQFLFSTYI